MGRVVAVAERGNAGAPRNQVGTPAAHTDTHTSWLHHVIISACTGSLSVTSCRRSERCWSLRSCFLSKVTTFSEIEPETKRNICESPARVTPSNFNLNSSPFTEVWLKWIHSSSLPLHGHHRGPGCVCRPLQDVLHAAPVWMLELLSSRIGVNANRDRGWRFPGT